MTANRPVPCEPYITHDELAACCDGVELEAVGGDPATTLLSRQTASEFLFYRTAQQYSGTCEETIYPCFECSPCQEDGPPFQATIDNGRMYNIRCTGNRCNCSNVSQFAFADSPILSIEEIKINGDIMPPADYSLHNDVLTRTDGGAWPYCNSPWLEDTEEDTWTVRYTFGHAAPLLLKQAAIGLACHWQDMCGSGDSCNACRIPRNAISMQRAGTSYQLLTPAALQALTGNMLLTGIQEVDLALQTLNPGGHRRMARIYG